VLERRAEVLEVDGRSVTSRNFVSDSCPSPRIRNALAIASRS
jgi:hypothetical protein